MRGNILSQRRPAPEDGAEEGLQAVLRRRSSQQALVIQHWLQRGDRTAKIDLLKRARR
jgi:hypothetical protein